MGLEVCPRLVLLTLSVPETDVVGEDGGGGCDDMHAEVDELDVALGSSEGFGLVSKSVDDVEDVCHGLGVVILVGYLFWKVQLPKQSNRLLIAIHCHLSLL